jgi:hypothetical protein
MDTVQSNAISAAGISVALSEHLLHPHRPVKNFRLLNGSSDRTLVHVQRRSEKSALPTLDMPKMKVRYRRDRCPPHRRLPHANGRWRGLARNRGIRPVRPSASCSCGTSSSRTPSVLRCKTGSAQQRHHRRRLSTSGHLERVEPHPWQHLFNGGARGRDADADLSPCPAWQLRRSHCRPIWQGGGDRRISSRL